LICFSSCIKKCVNHLNNQNNPYLYNGKELDAETGFYYYGARYYDPKSSLWLSVDPLAEKMPDFSAYAYAFNNPVMFVDPTGMEGEWHWEDKKLVSDEGDNAQTLSKFLGIGLNSANEIIKNERFLDMSFNGNMWLAGDQDAYGDYSYMKPGPQLFEVCCYAKFATSHHN
jgi:RHS repeat-associated protein